MASASRVGQPPPKKEIERRLKESYKKEGKRGKKRFRRTRTKELAETLETG